ncbi:MAG: WxcM-like domain-containing protein [Bacteroidetes bacterium]|nr:WxcM-like domain-containing protein [Bacteroidota bacterium]
MLHLSSLGDRNGHITPVNNGDLPFVIKRVFYLYDIPVGESRGAHSHIECHQFLIALSGAFNVHLDDGTNTRSVTLNNPSVGLHIPPGIWAAEMDFSSGAICLVLASHVYSENDYIRDYSEYIKYVSSLP